MTSLVPYLLFRDGDTSLRFLHVFGFDVVTEQRDDDGRVAHLELRRGDAVVMGGSATAEQLAQAPWDLPDGRGLYLGVEDVDATFARATAAGGAVVYGPEDTEWGARRARIRDPDGYEWSFGTYQPGQAWS